MDHHVAITVDEVLALVPAVTLLAGAGGVKRLVRSVGVMETPDVFPMVKPGELILTALFAVKDDHAAQLALVPELHRRGAAGLALKKRYIGELPAAMVEQANRLAFPLLELNHDSAFSDVMLPVFSQIANRQASVLARQQQAHKAVMKSVLEGRGLPKLAATLAELVANPVVIKDAAGQVLAVAGGEGATGLDLLSLSQVGALSGEYLISGGDTLHRSEQIQAGGRRLFRTVTPIISGDHTYGSILVWETGRPVRELDLLIIDSVSTVVALEMANQRAVLEVERRYKGEFLEALFAREIESEAALIQRARTFGWDLNRPHFAVALRVGGIEASPPRSPEEIQRLKDQYFESVSKSVGNGMVGQAGLHIVVLLQQGEKATEAKDHAIVQAQGLLGLTEPLQKALKVTAGIGRVCSGVQGLRKSFEEACRAVSVGEKVWGGSAAYHYDDLGLYQILSMLEPNADLQQFLSAIDKLVEYERDGRTELVQTLETYFACKGNVRKVSEKLFAHYNTVLYRLERIQQITGIQLEDATGRLHLQVALQVARLFGKLPLAAGN